MALAVTTGKLAISFAAVTASAVVGGGLIYAANSTSAKPGLAAPTITSRPASSTNATGASFTFTGPSGATFQCSRDAAAFTGCTSPTAYAALPQGAHTFQVRAVSGSTQSAATSYTWTIDTTPPPAPTFVTKPAAVSNSVSATFSFSSEAGASYLCKLDGAATFTACGNPQTFSGLAQGNHSLAVEAKDAAGNIGAFSSYSWKVDTVAPPAPLLTQKPNDPTPNATNTFAWTESEAGTSFQCSTENGAFAACSSPYTYVINTSNNGQHQFAVRAVDAAGNVSAAAAYTFKYDKNQPATGVPFQITGSATNMTIGVWKSIAVTISNPNTAVIYVSALTVTVAAQSSPAGCPSAANIELQQSNVSGSVVVAVPARGSVSLPAQGAIAPQIRLKNLPTVNQDVCKNKSFSLTYSGTAHN